MHKESLPDIRKTIALNAPIEKVWEAVSTSSGLAAWWMPSTVEAEPGHEFILHAGPFGDSPCKVTEAEAPNRFGFDWAKDWHISFVLSAKAEDKTELVLVHSGWEADKVTEFGQPHSAVRGIMDGGWEKLIKEKLPEYVEDGQA